MRMMSMAVFSVLVMAAFALFSVAAKNVWQLLTAWLSGRTKAPSDREKIDRAKAWTALAAIGAGAMIMSWLAWKGLVAGVSAVAAAAVMHPQALMIGGVMILFGIMNWRMASRLPPSDDPAANAKKRSLRRFALLNFLIGGALVAYALGYIG